jgi:T-lymphoma invasion and metastasis-inducing protein 1
MPQGIQLCEGTLAHTHLQSCFLFIFIQVLLACACKATKTTLGRLGIFTVTSFHALVSARKPLVLPNILGKGSNKGGMLSPKADRNRDHERDHHPKPRSRTPTGTLNTSISSE